MATTHVEFRAGRCHRQGQSNTVVPAPGRGLVSLEEEDGLMHLRYTDLESNAEEESLILFPGDASFIKAAERVHCLKFSSSSARYFFWHQDLSSDKDDERARRINELIGGQLDEPNTSGDEADAAMVIEGSTTAPVASTAPENAGSAAASTSTAPTTRQAGANDSSATALPGGLNSAQQMAQLQQILANITGGRDSAGMGQELPPFLLTDVLSLPVLQSLIANNPSLNESLLPFLPSDIPQNASSLQRAITSPEFKRSVSSFDRALRTGALGPLVAGLGLQQDSAMGVESFLEGIQRQADEIKAKETSEDKGTEEGAGQGDMQVDE